MPAAWTRMRTWPRPGFGVGRSTISRTSGPPKRRNWTSRMGASHVWDGDAPYVGVCSDSALHTLWSYTDRKVTMTRAMKRLPLLPAERALKVIAGRWKAIILYHLFDGPKRLSELKRLAPNVSQKVLIQQLREME